MAEDVSVQSSIEAGDYLKVAQAVSEEYEARKKRRGERVKIWDEIDRQLAMVPERSHKMNVGNQLDPSRAWMPEVELPLQAQTLEMLQSDNRRLKFPKNRNWFKCRAALTDAYLARYDAAGPPFAGERGPNARSILAQDNADRLAEGIIGHWHSQYDFRSHVDVMDSQAFSYGVGVGRVRKVKRKILGHNALMGPQNQVIPVLIPRNIRNTYLDDNPYSVMHEGFTLGPNIIQDKEVSLADLKVASDNDKTYVISELKKLTPNKAGNVTLIELEGDIAFDRGNETVIVENVVVTAASGEKGSLGMIRLEKGEGYSTYIVHNYNTESPSDVYATAPLVKGMPIAKAAAQALNRVIESAQLKTAPPIGYPKDDPYYAGRGGPVIQPHAKWPTIEDIKAYVEVGGDPATLFAIFTGLVNLYYDVTGVNQPRLGAQTKSHTTAFAKDAELTQGNIRTVDYVNSTLEGPMTKLLQIEYRMGLPLMKGQNTIYIEAWNEFVEIKKAHLPDIVHFMAIGGGAPADDQAQQRKRIESAQTALQIDSIAVQLGKEPKLDHEALITQLLSEGGWTDVTTITTESEPVQQPMTGQQPGLISGGLEALG